MKRIFKTLLLFFVCLTTEAQIFTVETVPNTKLVNNSYVSDPSHILNDTTIARINQILGDLETKATAQVAVVMLPSIGEADRFEFAQKLFEHWGIGQAENDNGLLILFIQDQRNIRFHTGFGLEGILSDARCKQIQQQFMVPSFKEGDYNSGMLLGIEKVAAMLTTPEAIEEVFAAEEATEDRYLYVTLAFVYGMLFIIMFFVALGYKKFQQPSDTPRIILSKMRWFLLYGFLPFLLFWASFQLDLSYGFFFLLSYGLIIVLFLERYYRINTVITPRFEKRGEYQALYNFYHSQNTFWKGAAIFFFVPMILVFLSFKKKRDWFRNHPRPCKKCNTTIPAKLTEQTEDEFLHSGQIAEEKIGVIDYDVWKCTSCGATEILSYPNKASNYTRCPKCNYLTYHFGARRTIEEATYTSQGRGEEERTCLHCGHHHIDTFFIAMLVAAASSSSDSDSSSSSSDSDSGGSWGGGDSGGGGSDSSW